MPGLLGIFKHTPKNSPRETPRGSPRSTPRGTPRGTPGISPELGPTGGDSPLMHMPGSTHSLGALYNSRTPTPVPSLPIDLQFSLESGPLIMYGTPQNSSGALLSGTLDMEVRNDTVLESSMLQIIQKCTYKVPHKHRRPGHVPQPTVHEEVIARWDILVQTQDFYQGCHEYVFSHLLPGSLPPSASHPMFNIEYYLEATAIIKGNPTPIKKVKSLTIGRSVESVQDKTSMRLFPPTDLRLSINLPTHIFPKASFVSELRVENLNGEKMSDGRYQRWALRKISWTFLETTKIQFPDGQDLEQEDTIYTGQLKTGWKFDPSDNGVAEITTRDFSVHREDLHKDVSDSVLNINVSHKLAAEVLIAEEISHSKTSSVGVPSGRARVLRVQFNIGVVDPPGLGISWDDEVPPVYADVPLSPPTYDTANTLEEIPHMTFSPLAPAMSPTLRHIDPSVGDGSPFQAPVSMGESFIQQIQRRVGAEHGDLRPVQSAPARPS